MSEEELAVIFKLLHSKWKEACITLEKQKKTTSVLHEEKQKLAYTITCLEEEITLLNTKLENMPKFVHMVNNSSDMLDHVLDENMKAIGFG